MVKLVRTLFKIESTDKDNTDGTTTTEWMETIFKTIDIDISNDNRLKMARIDDYWSKEKIIEIVDLLKEFQDVFS